MSIVPWLTCGREPADLYDLLGRPRFDPALADLKEAVLASYAELLPYQNHADPAVVRRAVQLQMELGRAEGTLADPAKLLAHHKAIVSRIQDRYAEAIAEGAAVETLEGLRDWLREAQSVHPERCDDIADVLQSVFGGDTAVDSLLETLQFAPAAPDEGVGVTEGPVGGSSNRVFQPRPPAAELEEDRPLPAARPARRRETRLPPRKPGLGETQGNVGPSALPQGAPTHAQTAASPEKARWPMPHWTVGPAARWVADNWHRDLPRWIAVSGFGGALLLAAALVWLRPPSTPRELPGEYGVRPGIVLETPLERALHIHPPPGTHLRTPAVFVACEGHGQVRLRPASSLERSVKVSFDGASPEDFAAYRENDTVELEAMVSAATTPGELVLHGLSLRGMIASRTLVRGRAPDTRREQSADDLRRWRAVCESPQSHLGDRLQLVGSYAGVSGFGIQGAVRIDRLFGQAAESVSCRLALPAPASSFAPPPPELRQLLEVRHGESVHFEVEVVGGRTLQPEVALVWLAPQREPQRKIHFRVRREVAGGPSIPQGTYPPPGGLMPPIPGGPSPRPGAMGRPVPPVVPFPAPDRAAGAGATTEDALPNEADLPPLRDYSTEIQAWQAIGSEAGRHFGRRLEMYGRFQGYSETRGQRSVRITGALGKDSITCQCDPSAEANAFLSELRNGEHVLFEVAITGSGSHFSMPSPFTLTWIARREDPTRKITCSPIRDVQLPQLDLVEHRERWERFRDDPGASVGQTLSSTGRYMAPSDKDGPPQIAIRPFFLPNYGSSNVTLAYLDSPAAQAGLSRLEPDQDVLFELVVTGGRRRYPEVSLLWMAPAARPDDKLEFATDVSEIPGQRLLTIEAHQGAAAAVAWSADGKYLATCGSESRSTVSRSDSDGSTKVWNAQTGELLHAFEEASRSVRDVVWLSPRPLLAAGIGPGVREWTLQLDSEAGDSDRSASLFFPLRAPASRSPKTALIRSEMERARQVVSLAWSETNQLLAAGTGGGTIFLIRRSATSPSQTRVKKSHSGGVQAIAWRPDGMAFATGHARSGVWVWNLDDELPARGLGVRSRLTGYWQDMCDEAEISQDAESVVLTDRTDADCAMLAWSPDGNRLAIAGKTLEVWDLSADDANRLLYHKTGPRSHSHFSAVQFSPDGRLLAAADPYDTVFLFDASTGDLAFQWKCERVVHLSFDPSGTRLATASESGNPVHVWNVGKPK